MTGQRWDPRYGRGRTGPLQADVPIRLPGGVWGPPPASGLVTFDAQGAPVSGIGTIDSNTVSSSLARSEWPMPVRWEVQLYLAIERVSYVGPAPAPPPVWPSVNAQAFNVEGLLQWRIESAQADLPVQLPLGPGVYPLVAALAGVTGLGATFPIIAQQVECRITQTSGLGDPALADSTWRWSVAFLLGLTSAGWPTT